MEQNVDNKVQNNFINLYNKNKKKFLFIIIVLFISISLVIALKNRKEKKNLAVAEKYIQANLLLTAEKKNNAKILYEEIILSKNKFYAILSLNAIIDKKLITNEKKILEYFSILEKSNLTDENKNLLKLKKALYYFKISNIDSGNDLLKSLIDNDTSLKNIAKELLKK